MSENSISSISTIISNSENSTLRCPNCKLIPSIIFKRKNDTLEYKCPNNHSEINQFDILYQKLKLNNNVNNIKCCNCSTKANFYSSNGNFYCQNHRKLQDLKKGNYLIELAKIDDYCIKDNDRHVNYCKTHNLSLCVDCEHVNKNCEIVNIHNLLFKEDEIKNYQKILDDIKKIENEHKNKFFDILNKFGDYLKKMIKSMEDLKIKIKKNSDFHLNFYLDLLNSYIFKKNNKCYNYNNINNIKINFNNYLYESYYNYEIPSLFDKLTNYISEIKNHFNDFLNTNYFDKNFKIEKLNSIKEINYQGSIYAMKILHDNRIAIGGHSSILYILDTNFNIDLEIKNENKYLYCIEQLKNKNIVLSFFKEIKIIEISKNKYYVIQSIENAHENSIYNVIEVNNNLISCSADNKIKIWSKENSSKYNEIFEIKENNYIFNIIKGNENEIIYDIMYDKIKFYDIKKEKEIKLIIDLNLSDNVNNFIIINDKLIIGGKMKIYFIDINKYVKIKEINFDSDIYSILKINDNFFIIGDDKGDLTQFVLDKYIPISVLRDCHKNGISSLMIYNNFILTGDKSVKIWK